MRFCLIITTRGKVAEVERVLQSLADQTFQDFEVIVSDQNEDDRLAQLAVPASLKGRFQRVRSSNGASCGRNKGIDVAQGEFLGFPDDDCVFPPRILEGVVAFFDSHPEYGFLSSGSYADDGKDSVSSFAKDAAEVSRYRVLSQCIEFAIFLRASALGEMRFDENMGVGSRMPWHSDEGPDLLLRLIDSGVRGYYDPRFNIWHPRPVTQFDEKAIDRNYRYACGNGYFYRKHRFPFWYFAVQMFKTAAGVLVALATLKGGQARLRLAKLRGRWRGWNAPIAS